MSFMPVEIAIPFRLDTEGRIAGESNPNRQIRQHVMSLINTEPGERVVLGDYGVALSDGLFEEDDESVAIDLGDEILAALARWEPGIRLGHVGAVQGQRGDGIALVEVQYQRADAPDTQGEGNSSNVAVLHVGGRVSEVVRG